MINQFNLKKKKENAKNVSNQTNKVKLLICFCGSDRRWGVFLGTIVFFSENLVGKHISAMHLSHSTLQRVQRRVIFSVSIPGLKQPHKLGLWGQFQFFPHISVSQECLKTSCFSFHQWKHLGFSWKPNHLIETFATLGVFLDQDYPKKASDFRFFTESFFSSLPMHI